MTHASVAPNRFKRFLAVEGSRMAFVDEGAGPLVVLLHGNPTSSFLWRDVIPSLMDSHRVIALDLIGMGDSDKPNIDYTLGDHCRFVDAFLGSLAAESTVLVGHDWGAAIAMHHARRHPESVDGLAFMETHVPPRMPAADYAAMGDGADFFRDIRAEGTGEDLVLERNVFIETVLPAHGVLRTLDEHEMAAYRAPFPTPRSRRPILAWARQIPIGGEPCEAVEIVSGNNEWLFTSPMPKLLLHATPGALITEDVVEYLRPRVPELEVVCVGAGTHFVQEDRPRAIGRALAEWLARVPRRGGA